MRGVLNLAGCPRAPLPSTSGVLSLPTIHLESKSLTKPRTQHFNKTVLLMIGLALAPALGSRAQAVVPGFYLGARILNWVVMLT